MNVNGWSSIWICILLSCGVNTQSLSMLRGFHNKFMSAKQQLTNNFYHNSRDTNNLKISAFTLWTEQLEIHPNFNNLPVIMRLNNYTLMLNNLDLWVLKDEKIYYKGTLMRQFDYDVKLVKGFEWQDRLFLLVCFQKSKNNICSLYSSTSDLDFTYDQPISDDGIPIDAHFFVQQGKLFLTMLFQAFDKNISRLRIYQWLNLYMDKELIPEIFSTAPSIILFGYGEDIILVLGSSGDNPLKIPSQVWSHKSNGEMTKVQYLTTDSPISITHFMERGEHFILILERDHDTAIYWWEGSEFVRWLPVYEMMKYFKVTVSTNLKNSTFLIFTHSNVLRIYLMTSAKLEKVYETEFKSNDAISILSATMFEENDITYMLVLFKSQRQIFISLLKIHVQILHTEAIAELSKDVHQSDSDQEDLDTVYSGLRSLKYQMDILHALLSSVLFTNKDVNISRVVRVSQEVHVESGDILKLIHTSQMDTTRLIDYLYNYTIPVIKEINLNKEKLQTTPVHQHRHLFFNGDVFVKEVKINSVTVDLLNGNTFEPGSYLSVKTQKEQRLKSVKAKKLKVNWLAIKEIGNKTVQDFLLADPRVKVPVSMVGLESRNLQISENMTINNITAKDLTNKMVTVETGEDRFNKIAQIAARGNPATPGTLKLQDHTVIQNLFVDFVDDISVKKILTSVFVKETRNVIHGNVHFKDNLRTNELAAGIFHLHMKQGPKFFPTHLYPHLQLKVPLGGQRLYSPLHSHNWARLNPIIQDGRRYKRDNTGRKIRRYKVKIFGDLKVTRLLFQNSSLVVNNHSVPTVDLKKTFWTHTTPQEVNGPVHFVQGITVRSNLESPIVNSQNLTKFATRRSNFKNVMFENVHVYGDMTSQNDSHWATEDVTVFKLLNVKHLQTEKINGEKSENLLRTKDLLQGGIKLMTENLKINGSLEVNRINSIDVKQKFKSAVMTDTSFVLNEVEFKNISGDNVKVKNLNNHSLESLFTFPPRENSSVVIRGDIHVSQITNVSLINNYPANFSQVLNKRKKATIYGKKKFNAQVIITNDIRITKMNNIPFESLFKNILRLSEDQDITGFYTIRNVEMKSIFNTSEINGVKISNFVYINQPQVNLTNNIEFKTVVVDGNVTSASLHGSCHLPKIEDEIVFEGTSQWSMVHISGDSTWPKRSDDRLQHLFDSTVQSNGNQTISGDVFMKHLSVKNIIVHLLNNKNITFIFQDSLSRSKENQVVTGKKTFLDSFKCKNIKVKGDTRVGSINNINVNKINENLVRQSGNWNETVYGHKIFLNGFRAFSLKCPEGTNGVKTKDIVGRHFKGIAPPLVVQSLKVVGPITVETINGVHIDSFLQDCIYLQSSEKQLIKGQIHITGNVTLEGIVTTLGINNISTNDVVFVNGKESVRISGCKRFLSNMEIETDPEIGLLNGRNLTETYRDSVKTDKDAVINGSVVIVSEVEIDTVYAREYFVGSKKLTYLNKTFLP